MLLIKSHGWNLTQANICSRRQCFSPIARSLHDFHQYKSYCCRMFIQTVINNYQEIIAVCPKLLTAWNVCKALSGHWDEQKISSPMWMQYRRYQLKHIFEFLIFVLSTQWHSVFPNFSHFNYLSFYKLDQTAWQMTASIHLLLAA